MGSSFLLSLLISVVSIVVSYFMTWNSNRALANQVTELDLRVRQLEENNSGGGGGGGGDDGDLEKRVNELGKRVDQFVSTTDTNVSSLSSRISSQGKRVDDLTGRVNECCGDDDGGGGGGGGGEDKNLDVRVQVLESTVKDIGARTSDNQSRIAKISQQQTSDREQLDEASEQSKSNTQSLRVADNRLNSLQDAVGNHTKQLTNSWDRMSKLETSINKQKKLSNLGNRINGLYIFAADKFFKQTAPLDNLNDVLLLVQKLNVFTNYDCVVISSLSYKTTNDTSIFEFVGSVGCLILPTRPAQANLATVILFSWDSSDRTPVQTNGTYPEMWKAAWVDINTRRLGVVTPDHSKSLYTADVVKSAAQSVIADSPSALMFLCESVSPDNRTVVVNAVADMKYTGLAPGVNKVTESQPFALVYADSARSCDVYAEEWLTKMLDDSFSKDKIYLYGFKYDEPVGFRPLD
jgi:peptidoglycan hydrolase CwlO-like protein